MAAARSVSGEAQPIFYSETFSVRHGIGDAGCFLRGIGATRRKHMGRLGVEYASSRLGETVDGVGDMHLLVDQLMDGERGDTLMIKLPGMGYTVLDRSTRLEPLRLVARWVMV